MTPRLATDETQAIVWRWEGEAFGNTKAEELSGVQVNLRFPGQYFDQETNLHYNWNRYYDPELGRYITSDPVGLAAGMNAYNYANSNSLGYYDPDGQFVFVARGVASLGLSLYDPYNRLTDDCLTPGEKAGRLAIDAAIGLAGVTSIKHGLRVVKALRGVTKRTGNTVARTTRAGDKAVRTIGPDGSVIDISPKRVKEFVPNTPPEAPLGALNRVKVDNAIPGGQGLKRPPTQQELDILKNVK